MARVAIIVLLGIMFVVGDALKLELLREEYGKLGTKLDFYEEEFQNGLSARIETNGPCKNLPRRWHKRPQSVDTSGTCGKVCSEKDCQGECIIIIPNNGDQQLSTVKFNKKVVSAQGCFYNEKQN